MARAAEDTETLWPSARQVLKMTEECTGMRYCSGKCNGLLPLSNFKLKQKPKNLCHPCMKERKKQFFNTQIRLAYNSLLSRARSDMKLFNQDRICISLQELTQMLTPDQIEIFSVWAIVPKRPTEVLTPENAQVIQSYQKRFLISSWKMKKNPALYMKQLESLPVALKEQDT